MNQMCLTQFSNHYLEVTWIFSFKSRSTLKGQRIEFLGPCLSLSGSILVRLSYIKRTLCAFICVWISIEENNLSFGGIWGVFSLTGTDEESFNTDKVSLPVGELCSSRTLYKIVRKHLKMLPQSVYKVNVFKYCTNPHSLSCMRKPTKLGHFCYLIVTICHGVTSLDLQETWKHWP